MVHTVGPVYLNGEFDEDALLAAEHGIRAIVFPAISAGVYGFPKERETRIGVREVVGALEMYDGIERVTLVAFSERDYGVYEGVMAMIPL